jgi:lipoprotein-anchoring transpeptidase ErfK/SrfK
MGTDEKFRASTRAGNQSQTVYWVLAMLAAGVVTWIWWGHRKETRTLPKTKIAATQKSAPAPVQQQTRPAKPVVVPLVPALPTTPVRAPAPVITAVPADHLPAQIESRIEPPPQTPRRRAPKILDAQIALVRMGISPGSLDGLAGSQTRAALRAFQQKAGLKASGSIDADTEEHLATGVPALTNYVVAEADLARLLPLASTWLGKSQQERLDYETILECIAEKFYAHPSLIKQLNPGIDWSNVTAGTNLIVPNVEYPPPLAKAASVKIYIGSRYLEAFDAENNLLAHFPCSIAQRVEKRPIGEELHVAVLAPNPNYTFDPAVFPESPEAQEIGRKLILNPGPNNPVGTVWIGLDKPGYGIHGTPHPEAVGRTESHGCFRLANWNAEYLLRMVSLGTPVSVEP